MKKPAHLSCVIQVALLISAAAGNAGIFAKDNSYGKVRSSVIKIYATFQSENFMTPWQTGYFGKGNGTGFLISNKRILTNAHVVSNAKFLEVQRDGDPVRYPAVRKFIGHDCDLAVLEVSDPDFYKGLPSLELADEMPGLNDEVIVIGYPMGGDRISLTKGVVSRIDYSPYSHSMVDEHLVIQVDAAINPGNSGGPIFLGNKVAGVAFQGLGGGDNIGYGIPLPVVKHFLQDIDDGVYDEYPESGIDYMELRNKALKKSLGLPDETTGIAVSHVDPFGSAFGILQEKDIILKIDGHVVFDDGTVKLDGYPVLFSELFERKQTGEKVSFDIIRKGTQKNIEVPLKKLTNPFVFRNLYDEKARFFIKGGLVFCPLNREILEGLQGKQGNAQAPDEKKKAIIDYLSAFATLDNLHKDREEFVIIVKRLPHEVNTYQDGFVNCIIKEINGRKISDFKQAKEAFLHPSGGYHQLRFFGTEETLFMDAETTAKADMAIFDNYGISKTENTEK